MIQKNISIVGSTGSIGTQSLEVVRELNSHYPCQDSDNGQPLNIVALSTNKNIDLLRQQIKEFKPIYAAVMDEEKAEQLQKELYEDRINVEVFKGIKGLIYISTIAEADILLTSVVGSVGLEPTIQALKHGKDIALANKETLVTAGKLVMEEANKKDLRIMPIDSEHSALFQCLNGERKEYVKKLILTCSGGAFKNHTAEQLNSVTASDALRHPTWNMGAKITIDSATLMNKGFEVIEAHWLYGIDYDDIDVVIHPQSIVHSMVEFKDNSILAQLGVPSMKIPIQYALTFPERIHNPGLPLLDLIKNNQLDFKEPNHGMFPCLGYAYEAGKLCGTLPAVMNAVNEIAVNAFINNKCKFNDIPAAIKKVMDLHIEQKKHLKNPELDEVLSADKWARDQAKNILLNQDDR